MNKSKHVPLQGWHDCLLKNACKNETQRNMWARGRTDENLIILLPCNQCTLLAIVRSCQICWIYFYLTVFFLVSIKRLYVRWLMFLSHNNTIKFFRQNFDKISHYKISQNLSTGKRVVSRGQTNWQPDMTNNPDIQHPRRSNKSQI